MRKSLALFVLWMPLTAFGSTVYTFSENVANRGTVGFAYTAPDYLETLTNYIPRTDFSCDTSGMPGWDCTGAYLTQFQYPNGPSVSVTLALVYTVDPSDAFSTDSVYDSFPGATLTADGSYHGFLNGASFTVKDPPNDASAAPEPATWGMLALASGLLLVSRLRQGRKLLSGFLSLAGIAGAAAISTENTCQPPQQSAYTSVGPCQYQYSDSRYIGSVLAQSSASLVVGAPGEFSTVSADALAYANPRPSTLAEFEAGGPLAYPDYAQTKVTLFAALDIPGPVRPGYIEMRAPDAYLIHGPGADGAGVSLSICAAGQSYCRQNGADYMTDHLEPFTLGGPFAQLNLTGQASAAGDFSEGGGEGGFHLVYQFRFLEADGVTPVAFSDAPATVGLLALGALPLLAIWKRRKRVSLCSDQR